MALARTSIANVLCRLWWKSGSTPVRFRSTHTVTL